MKRTIWLFIILIIYAKGIAQEPPVQFIIKHGKNKASISLEHENYDFITPVFKGVISTKIKSFFDATDTLTGYPKYRLDTKLGVNDEVNIYSLPAEKGEVIALSIREKKSKKVMNIFFRLNKRWFIADEITFISITFKKGNYFFDLCAITEKYSYHKRVKSSSSDYLYHTKHITDIDIRNRKISIKKLNKLLKKDSCKQYIK